MNLQELIRKYDVPVPRYTSYPTVPHWETHGFSIDQWWGSVKRSFAESNAEKGISIYIHLPFCESLCTYCACNTRITKNHAVEEKYLNALLAEWKLYLDQFSEAPNIREIHLGGGTPTFFSPLNLSRLMEGITSQAVISPRHEFSFEGHPNNTTEEHLRTLFDAGFRRVSFGVQDLDPKVQQAINRIQPFENLDRAVKQSRALGYHSISFDLIYGLPYQTRESVNNTVNRVIGLRPDRIAFYSYAHVPWMRPGQRGYEDADLPSDVLKRTLYEDGRKLFNSHGYHDVGMDHFALETDDLFVAKEEGRLHRNFMGYTNNQTDLLIGLGTSSISDAKYAYAQNLKKVEEYQHAVTTGDCAIFKGHIHTDHDRLIRKTILDIACKGRLALSDFERVAGESHVAEIDKMREEGLIGFTSDAMYVTSVGRHFIRNICSVFDQKLREKSATSQGPVFSKAI